MRWRAKLPLRAGRARLSNSSPLPPSTLPRRRSHRLDNFTHDYCLDIPWTGQHGGHEANERRGEEEVHPRDLPQDQAVSAANKSLPSSHRLALFFSVPSSAAPFPLTAALSSLWSLLPTLRVYTEKEITLLSTKAGVNANTIPDINQALVDDALVDKAKIGGSNYFWSFPEKKDRKMQIAHEETLKAIAEAQEQAVRAASELADAKRGREDEGGERPRKLARIAELARETEAAQKELDKLKENDPRALADLRRELKLCQDAANRWTDNIFEAQSFLVKKKGMGRKEANKFLRISDAFDYPEDKIPKTAGKK